MSSAEGDWNFLGAAKQLGAVATLHKPFDEDALRTAITAALPSTAISTPSEKPHPSQSL
jgi:FixJ family two-component response regulator